MGMVGESESVEVAEDERKRQLPWVWAERARLSDSTKRMKSSRGVVGGSRNWWSAEKMKDSLGYGRREQEY